MLKCAHCEAILEESECVVVESCEPYEFHGECGTHVASYLICPVCGDEHLEDIDDE